MKVYIITTIDENSELRSVQTTVSKEEAQAKMKEILKDAKEYFHNIHGSDPTYFTKNEDGGAVGNDDHCYSVQISETELETGELSEAVKKILETYLPEEQKHWEESEKPDDHIYNSLLKLKRLL